MDELWKQKETDKDVAAIQCDGINKCPTWIQSQKQQVEEHGGEEEALESEWARMSQQQFSVEELEHGLNFTEDTSCRRQNSQGRSLIL